MDPCCPLECIAVAGRLEQCYANVHIVMIYSETSKGLLFTGTVCVYWFSRMCRMSIVASILLQCILSRPLISVSRLCMQSYIFIVHYHIVTIKIVTFSYQVHRQ